jgi:hypothetical protein
LEPVSSTSRSTWRAPSTAFWTSSSSAATCYFPFTQLLVEYHHRFFESAEGKRRQRAVDEGLKAAGFKVLKLYKHIAPIIEISYIKTADFEYCTRNPYVN